MIGVAAPILLTSLRFAQGLAIGGQWGGAMLLVTERFYIPTARLTVRFYITEHLSQGFLLKFKNGNLY